MNDRCYICDRPKRDWPMAFRGERACSVTCQKALQRGLDAEMADGYDADQDA